MCAVTDAAEVLSRGEPTPFALEGALRFHLRVERILGGESWDVADEEARDIIGRALRRLKVYRPLYSEGQPLVFYHQECVECGTPIVTEDRLGIYHAVYCSVDCSYAGNNRKQVAKRSALKAAARAGKVCPVCGEIFSPDRASTRYCGSRCREIAAYARKCVGPRRLRAGSAEARDVLPGRLEEPVEPANRNRQYMATNRLKVPITRL